jgi:hypothetical protein
VTRSVVAAVLMVAAAVRPVERPAAQTRASAFPSVRVYDDSPTHLWNQLHAALFVRIASDGRVYGVDRADPLLWSGSKYLLEGDSHQRAADRLKQFVDRRGERLISDPVKRAMLQRDLWMVFDWLEASHTSVIDTSVDAARVRKAADDLRPLIAKSIARLALTRDELRALPDNYAAAARGGGVPADLFSADGPWVSVGRPDGPVAAQHVRDDGPGKNSVFLVFLRLPAGRHATIEFLERLRSFAGPMWMPAGYPNPELPAFPAGTQVALVRRALLIDGSGRIAATPLVEQVQLRVYREIRPMTAEEFDAAHMIDRRMFTRAGQEFEEFSLSRAALFAHRSGGLLPMAAADGFFLTFSSHGVDPFETAQMTVADAASAKFVCKDCHGAPGVYSFNSFMPFRLLGPGAAAPARLSEIPLVDSERTAIAWKERRADWRALRTLLRR